MGNCILFFMKVFALVCHIYTIKKKKQKRHSNQRMTRYCFFFLVESLGEILLDLIK